MFGQSIEQVRRFRCAWALGSHHRSEFFTLTCKGSSLLPVLRCVQPLLLHGNYGTPRHNIGGHYHHNIYRSLAQSPNRERWTDGGFWATMHGRTAPLPAWLSYPGARVV